MSSTRDFYRVTYPARERPALVLADAEWSILDLSESGIRYQVTSGELPEVGDEVYGEVRFHRGDRVLVAGEVVRVDERSVALRLEPPGLPFRFLLEEQQYLRTKYFEPE